VAKELAQVNRAKFLKREEGTVGRDGRTFALRKYLRSFLIGAKAIKDAATNQ
jgi:hypothetical protein